MSAKLPSTFVEGFHDEQAVRRMKYNVLGNTGLLVSHLGFGGTAIGGHYGEAEEEEAIRTVQLALKLGINYIDTAPFYGLENRAEAVLGKALVGIPRQSYYVATKVGRYDRQVDKMFDFSAERTIRSVDESLQRLGLDYVDVIQVHDLEFAPNLEIILNETLPALQKVKEAGKARFIGITGYPLGVLREVMDRSSVKLDIVLSYCRCCLNDNTLTEYLPHFVDKGLGIVNAAIVGMGMLTNSGPPSWHPANETIKQASSEAAKYCQSKGLDIARLAIFYSLSQPGPHTHLVSAAQLRILEENLEIATDGITPEEVVIMEEILEKFFKRLPITNWEQVEVDRYWNDLKQFSKQHGDI